MANPRSADPVDLLDRLQACAEDEGVERYPGLELTRLVQRCGLDELHADLVAALLDVRRALLATAVVTEDENERLVRHHLEMLTSGARHDRNYDVYLGLPAILEDRGETPGKEILHRRHQLRLLTGDLARLAGVVEDLHDARSLHRGAHSVLEHVTSSPSQHAGHDGLVVAVTLLPITPVPEEQIFIRCLQAFECLFQTVNLGLSATITALDAGKPDDCHEILHTVVDTTSATPALWRALTTIGVEQFHAFRSSTMGTSALASVRARQIEALVDELPPGREDPPILTIVPARTLRAALDDGDWLERDEPAARETIELLAAIDRWFSAWKRTHVTIARRYIGDAAGTGGTDGVRYLERWAHVPLMPFLGAAPSTIGSHH